MRHPVASAALLNGAMVMTVLGAAPVRAEEPPSRPNPRTDFTAYTRPAGRVAVGPLKLELGLIDEVTIGSYVPPWFAFPILGVPVPNAYLKLRSWWSGPLTLATRGGVMYIDGSAVDELADGDATASMTVLSGQVDASVRINPQLTLSLGLDLTHIHAGGAGSDSATSVEGASTADTIGSRIFLEWRLTRVFSPTLLVRYVVSQSPIAVDADYATAGISVDTNLSTETSASTRRFTVVPGVSFDWEHWELSLGVGYGVFPIPGIGLSTAKALPVVDFAFAYRFDLYD
jgi:hypothetical protein